MKFKFFSYEIVFEINKIVKKEFQPIQSPVTQKKDIDVSKILHMKDSGMSNREIARKLKVSEGTIRNRLKKFYNH